MPQNWKIPKRVEISESGTDFEGRQKNIGSPSSLRPICLLNEMGKALERIVANIITTDLSNRGPDTSDNKFRFRVGHSTIDVIESVLKFALSIISHAAIAPTVSICHPERLQTPIMG